MAYRHQRIFFTEIPHPALGQPLGQNNFFNRIQVDKSFVVIESFDSGMARCAKFKDFIRRGIFLYQPIDEKNRFFYKKSPTEIICSINQP